MVISKRTVRRLRKMVVGLPFGDWVNSELSKRAIRRGDIEALIPTEQLLGYYERALDDLNDHGVFEATYFEAGVFAGDSLATWWRAAENAGVPMRAFAADSFQGLPPGVEDDEGAWEEGMFWCPRPVTEWNLGRKGVNLDDVELIEGWFDETLTAELGERVGTVHVAMLDADAYSSTVPILEFLTPILADRAWMIFDDWYSTFSDGPATGVERAFNEWLARNPEWSRTDVGDYDLVRNEIRRLAGKVLVLDRSTPAESPSPAAERASQLD